MAKLCIGTSGWSYSWENFYPKKLASNKRLSYFSKYFHTAEVNYSFYHLPETSVYKNWVKETPKNFTFAIKLSRYITHIKRLKGVKAPLKKFLRNAKALGSKLGPILIQMPPSFKLNLERLEEFLETAKKIKKELKMPKLRLAFEFRHKTWFSAPQVLKILKKHNAAFVFAHSSKYPYPKNEPVTANFVYLRFHGPKALFASKYRKQKLSRWIPKIKKWLMQGLDVYAYFNNDTNGYAVKDAKSLLNLTK